jgi:hypothetical protein
MNTIQLSDTQRVLLAAAAARDSGLVLPAPANFNAKGVALTRVLQSLLNRGLILERATSSAEEAFWRQDDAGERYGLQITAAGLRAIGVEIDPDDGVSDVPTDLVTADKLSDESVVPGGNEPPADRPALPKGDSKLGTVIAALQRPQGATVPELSELTGWLPHSVRGAMSGALKKKLGLTIVSEKAEPRGRVYRIVNAGAQE